MRIINRIILGLVGFTALILGCVYLGVFGPMIQQLPTVMFGSPEKPFNTDQVVPQLDYSLLDSWVARPEVDDVADLLPAGLTIPENAVVQGEAPVDVFFTHPTGFLRGSSWIYTLDRDTATEENTQWMMANQASAFNGCCNVYAPRYRQGSIFAYLNGDDIREQVLGFAYQDVAAAFDYFIDQLNEGRPFIIASHSQGSHHSIRLLREKVNGSALVNRMVAAYVIGGNIAKKEFDDLLDVGLCDGPLQTGCAVHWDTWSESVINKPPESAYLNACVNPLSWSVDGGLAAKSEHVGAVPIHGDFQVSMSGQDRPSGVVFEALDAPIEKAVQAQCKGGFLFITDQSENDFGLAGGSFGGGNYHGLDYPIFHMDIRENAKLRSEKFLRNSSEGL